MGSTAEDLAASAAALAASGKRNPPKKMRARKYIKVPSGCTLTAWVNSPITLLLTINHCGASIAKPKARSAGINPLRKSGGLGKNCNNVGAGGSWPGAAAELEV